MMVQSETNAIFMRHASSTTIQTDNYSFPLKDRDRFAFPRACLFINEPFRDDMFTIAAPVWYQCVSSCHRAVNEFLGQTVVAFTHGRKNIGVFHSAMLLTLSRTLRISISSSSMLIYFASNGRK